MQLLTSFSEFIDTYAISVTIGSVDLIVRIGHIEIVSATDGDSVNIAYYLRLDI